MNEIYNDLVDFLWSLALSFAVLISDVLLAILDGLMTACIAVLDSFTYVFESMDVMQYIQQLPPVVLQVMSLCGINYAMTVLMSALLIRLMLQLIPFVRLGS